MKKANHPEIEAGYIPEYDHEAYMKRCEYMIAVSEKDVEEATSMKNYAMYSLRMTIHTSTLTDTDLDSAIIKRAKDVIEADQNWKRATNQLTYWKREIQFKTQEQKLQTR